MAFSIELIAQVAHEINRAYCQAIGDDSQPCWNDAPRLAAKFCGRRRTSAYTGTANARRIPRKMDGI